jgi:hypothetical protein
VSRRAAAFAALALALAAVAVVWWWGGAPAASPGVVPAQVNQPADRTEPANAPAASQVERSRSEPAPAAAKTSPDPVGGAPDLKRVFDQFIGSSDPGQRRVAVRAFDACFPAFLPAPSQAPSPEPLIRALPGERRAQREAAYRSLFARCQGFLGQGRESVQGLQMQLQGDHEAQEPGLRAHEDLLAGRTDRIETLIAQGPPPTRRL